MLSVVASDMKRKIKSRKTIGVCPGRPESTMTFTFGSISDNQGNDGNFHMPDENPTP